MREEGIHTVYKVPVSQCQLILQEIYTSTALCSEPLHTQQCFPSCSLLCSAPAAWLLRRFTGPSLLMLDLVLALPSPQEEETKGSQPSGSGREAALTSLVSSYASVSFGLKGLVLKLELCNSWICLMERALFRSLANSTATTSIS